MNSVPADRDLVLVGGGHAHVGVIRALAMAPIAGVRVSLINSQSETPYSGMLPGFLAGQYSLDECHIDLHALCQWAGVRLIRARVVGVDAAAKRIHLIDAASGLQRPDLDYDLLSLNAGATPDLSVAGASTHAIPVKPISHFVSHWQRIRQRAAGQPGLRVAVVGGGVGAVEIALAGRAGLASGTQLALVTGAGGVLPGAPARVRRAVMLALAAAKVRVRVGPVTSVGSDRIYIGDDELAFDACLWNTQAAAPRWLASSGFEVDQAGFACIEATLQLKGQPDIFAAGDMVSLARPKAGVFAVRAGPVLAANLRARLVGGRLRRWRVQRRWLALINLCDGRAIGLRGRLSAQGRWLWRLKDRIDRDFMRKFAPPFAPMPTPPTTESVAPLCMGCGGKVARQALGAVDSGRDAASFTAIGRQLVTVDTLTDFIGDPYSFARIAGLHALGDLSVAGASADGYLSSVGLAQHADRLQARDLAQISGGLSSLGLGQDLGGHTWISQPPSLSLTVFGAAGAKPGQPQPGDRVWLSRPLGSGLLLRGLMDSSVRGGAFDHWLAHAIPLSVDLTGVKSPHAMTDLTGFGLAQHLRSICADLVIEWHGDWRVWPGVDAVLAGSERATLAPSNLAAAWADVQDLDPRRQALAVDPQTLGGVIAVWPADYQPPPVWQCVARLTSPIG
ncbi:bifunctional NADH dehydrogenase FAD-containing subunit/selenide, water dikinase SelD [Litorivicinus lipolyticus]|uniref:Bifunctional NADH dehydrogenase FAD-containing subunit/selenide, water dikinase SelD n=1 Tax=Litorivicinus lipolyticus TaxID=418701 RepID=A0A5Q2QDC8_9GAMM|nr:FAD-dependent oxidoreductase [Litorivicinus lipolyticus]QGG80026.1 bifunctional NADH dehydrogenase FAD-containing subunit/selenide, water dikinase SelD [Litorivicinus lipolyticus]